MKGLRHHLTYRLLAPLILGYVLTLTLAFVLIENQADSIRERLIQHRSGELAETFLLAVESNPTDDDILRIVLSMSTFTDVDLLFILDDDKKSILAASRLQFVGQLIDTVNPPELRERLMDAAINRANLFERAGGDLHYLSYKLPLFAPNSAALRKLTFVVQIRQHAIAAVHADNARITRIGLAISLAVLIILMFFLVRRYVLRPILQLNKIINQSKAEQAPVLADFTTPDEIGVLINTYNQMIIAQHERQIELRKAKQESEAAARSKSNFLATVTHEIRTPLNGILGLNQLLLQTDMNREQTQYVQLIKSSGKQLLALVNDILDYSKIEANKMTMSLNPLDLTHMMEDLYAVFKLTADAKDIQLNIDVPDNLPHVQADSVRLRQILINLIGNALKFTRQGSVSIRLKTKVMKNKELQIEFQIEDTGIGIRKEDQARLFEKFTQADSSIVREFGGSGLGLTICRQLISLMGGTLRFDSIFGKGSSFHVDVSFPIVDITTVPTSKETHDVQSNRQVHILVAEDTAVNRMILEKMLVSHGHTVVSVVNGQQAVDRCIAEPFDIVLMDCQMPIMDGLEAARIIRKTHPDLPIIAVTAGVTEEIRLSCLESGMNDFLTKPLDFPTVIKTINYWLENTNNTNAKAPSEKDIKAI
ncbi:MAG: signal transduction histidine kinase/CheY-like chemotaxis protein [Candidatus Pseudothioglobus sp.]|jgi:signal transduction histidine kinase/CheY-like chemotaxis protein